MSSRARVLILAGAAALALAPAAHAATTPVGPGGLQAAVTAAAPGDTLQLAAGDFAEAVTIPAAKTGLILDGAAGARITGSLAVQAPGTVLRTLTLASAAAGLTVSSTGEAALERVLAARTAGEDPVITSAGKLALTDSTVANTSGSSGIAASGASTSLVRTTVVSTPPASDAVALSNTATGDRAFAAASSLLVGGATAGSGIRATTSGGVPLLNVIGAFGITLRHVTIAGASSGLTLSSAGAVAGGAITAAASGSIVHPASSAASSQLGGGASAFTATDTDGPGQPQNTPDPAIFAPNYRLRADSPAIGKGGPLADGESATDLNGVARPTTGTDMGAVQFVNGAPTTGLTLSSGVVDEGATVTAVLAPSDPDLGDTIGVYAFNWGDGTQTVGQSPTASHTYAKPGVYAVKGAVADARNAPSAIATAVVTVQDKSAPAVTVGSPKNGQKLKYRKRRRLTLKGTDTDATGVAKIEVALTRKTGKRCFQYGTTFKKAACSKLTFKRATLRDTTWSLKLRKRVVLAKGTYTLRVRSTDGVGNVSKGYSTKAGTLVRFTVR